MSFLNPPYHRGYDSSGGVSWTHPVHWTLTVQQEARHENPTVINVRILRSYRLYREEEEGKKSVRG